MPSDVQLIHTHPRTKLVKHEPKHGVEKSGGTGVARPDEQRKSWIVCCVEAVDPSVTCVQLPVEKAAAARLQVRRQMLT